MLLSGPSVLKLVQLYQSGDPDIVAFVQGVQTMFDAAFRLWDRYKGGDPALDGLSLMGLAPKLSVVEPEDGPTWP